MKSISVSRDFVSTAGIEAYLDEQLRYLTKNRRDIRSIRVTLGDIHGPDGVDKYCVITIHLRCGQSVRVVKVARELSAAIAIAAQVAERRAQEIITRKRSKDRRFGAASLLVSLLTERAS